MAENEEQEGEHIAGFVSTIVSKVKPAKNAGAVKRALPPTLNRPKRHNRFPHINTNVLLVQKYGQATLDKYADREQRELLGSAFESDDDANYDVSNPA